VAVKQINVIDGIYTRLTGDSDFNTAIGGSGAAAGRLYYAIAGQDETLPFVVFQVIDSTQFDTFQAEGYEYRVQFSLYDDRDAGPRAVGDLGDDLRARLDTTRFTVTNADQMLAEEDLVIGPYMVEDGSVWRLDLQYFIRGLDTS
jgi:hypothetical protein